VGERVKVDEDLPRAVAEALRDCGHDVRTVAEQSYGGWADNLIWSRVQAEERILLTADKRLADVRRLRGTKGSGIVLLRLERESWQGYARLVHKLVASVPLGELMGSITVVSDSGIRIRRR
jgi:predicted nuclease of predicted toxin-antitoxin system